MTSDCLVALSFVPALSRVGLSARLQRDDPRLVALAAPFLDAARRARDDAARSGIQVVSWDDVRFPAALLTLPDAPPALWVRGSIAALNTPSIAIVGSRAATAVGLETATRLGAGLAGFGVTVVSGLARGVDSAAHRGALSAGATVAVLGSGVDVIYPAEHALLAGQIAERGAVISEYPPGALPYPGHFPQRNRLISGLSRAVVVVEAAERSGSLITAGCALEQGREVMAVPGNVLSGRNRGAHALIRDGARIVECAADILEDLGWSVPDRTHATVCSQSGSVDPLLAAMEPGHAYDLDALSALAGVDGVRLLPRLMALEIHRSIYRVAGGRFVRSS